MLQSSPSSRRQALVEIFLIFVLFALQAAYPAPEVNEPYYLGKAIHYWNPAWLHGDFFMESPDTHTVFYFSFGWISLYLTPTALAWTGRVLTWFLLAWSWRRLSAAVVPRAWYSILTAALFALLTARCHMAGEWAIGGVEAKGFAYAFVFFGLESLLRNRWNRALVLLGIASAFHVLVGGWAAVAAGIAWIGLHRREAHEGPAEQVPGICTLWPGLFGGFLFALPGLIPSLMLDWGVDFEIARQSHGIYVFERLPHHLVLSGMKPEFIARFCILCFVWLLLAWRSVRSVPLRRLRAYAAGALCITLTGAAIHLLLYFNRALAADLLRYYWFRLTDIIIPLAVALETAALLVALGARHSGWRRGCLAVIFLVLGTHFSFQAVDLYWTSQPRSHKTADYWAWRDACRWIVASGAIPPDATFITPRMAQTFKWYTGRSDAATWKDVPQSAGSLVAWWDRIGALYATEAPPPNLRWHPTMSLRGEAKLKQLGERYHADYLITERVEPLLDLDVIYKNRSYVIYRLR